MWHKNLISVKIKKLWSQSSYILHKIHSHSHLILDPESAFYDHFRGGEAPSEVVVVCRFRIQDQAAVAVDFMQNIRICLTKYLIFGQKYRSGLMPHNAI